MTENQPEIIEQQEIQEEPSQNTAVKSRVAKPNNNRWYILQCYSGQEYKVKSRIEKLIETKKLKKKISKVLIPEESTIEIKDNKRLEKNTKIYPGYIFVEMKSDESVWFELRKITGVAKFIGSKNKPTPITENEVLGILNKVGEKTKKIEVDFEKGDVIKVAGGPFRGYTGSISEINAEKGKLKAMLSVFGRETPVELDFNQVEKTVK